MTDIFPRIQLHIELVHEFRFLLKVQERKYFASSLYYRHYIMLELEADIHI